MHGTSGLGLVLQFILNLGTSLLRKPGEDFAIYRSTILPFAWIQSFDRILLHQCLMFEAGEKPK